MPGRPRDSAVDDAVLDAVMALLATHRYADVTMAAIARSAGVGKPSVYLRWPSRAAVVADAMVRMMTATPFPDRGSLATDLTAGLRRMIALLTTTGAGRALPGLLADLAADPDLATAFRERYFEPRWASIRAAVDRAVIRGELAADVDVDLVVDFVTGPVYYRLLVPGRPLRRSDAARFAGVITAAFARHR